MARPMTEAVSLRYEFNEHERGDLGAELAQIYQEKAKLDEDRKSMAAQLKEREAGMENRIGTLSRQITAGHEMRTYECTLRWDDPNVGEVSYYRQDNGALIKTRAMTAAERQLDLPLQTEEQTKNNVVSFFQKGGEVVEGGKETVDGEAQPEPSPEAAQPQEGAAEGDSVPVEPPPDWQGSLEEYQAHLAQKEKPKPALPARGKRPKKDVDTPPETTIQ
jgi:hypothetical protein